MWARLLLKGRLRVSTRHHFTDVGEGLPPPNPPAGDSRGGSPPTRGGSGGREPPRERKTILKTGQRAPCCPQ